MDNERISNRRIEFAWKKSREWGLDRAQPGQQSYEDAKLIEELIWASYDEDNADEGTWDASD